MVVFLQRLEMGREEDIFFEIGRHPHRWVFKSWGLGVVLLNSNPVGPLIWPI